MVNFYDCYVADCGAHNVSVQDVASKCIICTFHIMNTRYSCKRLNIFTSAYPFRIRRSREPHQKGGWHRSRRNWRGLRRRRVVPHRPRRRLKGSSRLMSVNIIRNLVASPFFFDFSIQTSSRQSLTTTPSSGQTRTWPNSPTGT